MSIKSLLRALLGVEDVVVEKVELAEARGHVAVHVRPTAAQRGRCSKCRRPCGGYDQGGGRRSWRALDVGAVQLVLEGECPRVHCPEHGVIAAHVPWARPGSRFTRPFEEQVAWLAVHMNKTALCELMRISWRTVGRIIERVAAEAMARTDVLDGLRRIGIDEISYRRNQKYMVVVVDHGTGRLVWAREGRDAATVRRFFDALGAERSSRIELVSADAAGWIETAVRERCPNAELCMDPFHVVQWATDALDELRRELWNDLRRRGEHELARSLKRSRYALWKNPENLTAHQRAKLEDIEQLNRPLFRAYLLKEQLRDVFKIARTDGPQAAKSALSGWLRWASRSKLPSFVSLAESIRSHLRTICATFDHGLSNALVEGINTRLRLLHRMAFGFHSGLAMIALAMLKLGGLCPPLPARA